MKLENWPYKIKLKGEDPYTEPIELWCRRNINNSWATISTVTGVYFLFKEERDVIGFSLRWAE